MDPLSQIPCNPISKETLRSYNNIDIVTHSQRYRGKIMAIDVSDNGHQY